ncbi:MAG: hypothetical protein IJ193_08525, partial [Bacilli bacterium]|nr:hypothetical protein [Bacilli bacterium]
MNYLQIFAKGGKIDTKAIKSEIARIFMLEDSPEKVEQLWQDAVNTYGSEEGVLSEIFKQVGENPSDESVQKAMMNVLNYTPMEESQMFKCGGKLQQLTAKFAKGGSVDCGCNGIKLDNGGRPIPEGASRTITQRDTTDWYPFRGGMIESVHPTNGDAPTYKVFDGVTPAYKYSVAPKLENEIGIFARPLQAIGIAAKRITPEVAAEYETARQRTFGVPCKQPGGAIKELDFDNLTNRQARQASAETMGFNAEQYDRAYQNALNALRRNRPEGLRGRALRNEARKMVIGLNTGLDDNPYSNVPSTSIQDAKAAMLSSLPTTVDYSKYNEVVPEEHFEEVIPTKPVVSRTLNNKYQQEARIRSAQAAKETIAAAEQKKQERSAFPGVTLEDGSIRRYQYGDTYDISGEPSMVAPLSKSVPAEEWAKTA